MGVQDLLSRGNVPERDSCRDVLVRCLCLFEGCFGGEEVRGDLVVDGVGDQDGGDSRRRGAGGEHRRIRVGQSFLVPGFGGQDLLATGTPGISAVQLQRQLGPYQTAWTMLHKLRRAMVDPARTLLTGEVEVDECEVGGRETGRRGGRQLAAKAAQVVVAVEVRGQGSGRVRMTVIPNASGYTLGAFIADNVAPGAIVHTDGWMGYAPLAKKGYDHRPRSQRAAKRAGDPYAVLPRVHRAISNFKSWLRGTHRSVSNEHLQVYMDEFIFRYNRQNTPMVAFQRLLGLGT